MTDELDRRLSEFAVDLKEMRREVRSEMSELRASMTRLADAMVSIAKIEVVQSQHAEAFGRVFRALEEYKKGADERLREHEEEAAKRIGRLEEQAPVSKLVSGWVLAWVVGAVGLLGGVAAAKVLGI